MTEYYGWGGDEIIEESKVEIPPPILQLEKPLDSELLSFVFSLPYIVITWSYIFINYF